ncbi:hypothetical protein [Micromonospora sp. WMMD964]|nr:hypothetical protein [Micromonospora sp. WMMD964]WFE99109.1 hypothetical protein O7616_19605 [Micromonospora sp. WMMD964]
MTSANAAPASTRTNRRLLGLAGTGLIVTLAAIVVTTAAAALA